MRMDAGVRAAWLARALWLRLEDARREIPGVLVQTNWQGRPALKWVPMPWAAGSIQLVRQPGGLVIPPSAGGERAPVWVLPDSGAAAVYQALPWDAAEPVRRPVRGLDELSLPHVAVQPDGVERSLANPAEARIFFERQRRIDGLASEMDALLGQILPESTPLAVLIASDGASVYARSRGLDIPGLDLWAAGAARVAELQGKVRAVSGTDAVSGAVIVDLATESLPVLSERILLVMPVSIALLAVFLALRQKMAGRGLAILFFAAAVLPAVIFWNDACQRQAERHQQRERIERGILERHQHSDAILARAAPRVWRDFPVLETAGISQSGPENLALLLFLVLVPGVGFVLFVYGLSGEGVRLGLLPAIVPLTIVGTVFVWSLVDALPEFRTPEGSGSFALVLRLAVSLAAQTILALPVALAWAHCGRLARSLLLAVVCLPLVAPVAYRILLATRVSGDSAVDMLMSLLSGLPLVVLAMVFARSRIPLSVRKALALECGSVWRRYRSLDLWVCLVGSVPAWALSAWLTLVRTGGPERPGLPVMILLSLVFLGTAVRLLPLWTRHDGQMEES